MNLEFYLIKYLKYRLLIKLKHIATDTFNICWDENNGDPQNVIRLSANATQQQFPSLF